MPPQIPGFLLFFSQITHVVNKLALKGVGNLAKFEFNVLNYRPESDLQENGDENAFAEGQRWFYGQYFKKNRVLFRNYVYLDDVVKQLP